MEQIDLTTPVVNDPTATNYFRIASLTLDWEREGIKITLVGENGVRTHIGYAGDEAVTLMVALNKVNLSTKSLQKRIMEKLLADGHLIGAISGTPE